jgi:hypothetical protein
MKYKILIDFRKYNKWLIQIQKKDPNFDLLYFGNVPFKTTRDGKTSIQYIQGGAASEIGASYSDLVYDLYEEVNVKADFLRQVIIVDNIDSRVKANKIKKAINSMHSSGKIYMGRTLPKISVKIVQTH